MNITEGAKALMDDPAIHAWALKTYNRMIARECLNLLHFGVWGVIAIKEGGIERLVRESRLFDAIASDGAWRTLGDVA